jgi:hypothetical protein
LKTLSQWLHGNLGGDLCAFIASDGLEEFDIASIVMVLWSLERKVSIVSNVRNQVCETESQVVAR